MSTTVLVSKETHRRLVAARDTLGARSMDDAIARLLRAATPSAQDLFARNKRKVRRVMKNNGLTRLTAFGSRVREDRTPGSDLDLVTRFPERSTLLDVIRIQDELADAFGVPVDLGSEPEPSSRLGRRIAKEGIVLVGPDD